MTRRAKKALDAADKHPPREEMEERIDFTAKMLSRRLYKSDIKRLLKARYSVNARTCESYLARAREILAEWSGKSKVEHRIESLAFYESIVRGDGSAGERMAAQQNIDRLLGLAAPQRTEHTGEDGGPIQVVTAETVLAAKTRAEEYRRERAAEQRPGA